MQFLRTKYTRFLNTPVKGARGLAGEEGESERERERKVRL